MLLVALRHGGAFHPALSSRGSEALVGAYTIVILWDRFFTIM